MSVELPQRAREILAAPNFATVSTMRGDNTIHAVVVWVDVDESGRVLLNSAEGRAWPRNVARDPRLTITVPNLENPYEFVSITGRVVETDHDDAPAHIDALAMKYLGQDKYPFLQPGEVRVKLTVAPERVHVQAG